MAAIAAANTFRVCRLRGNSTLGACFVSQRYESSSTVVRGQHSNLAAYKRGTGGRSSFSGIVATVLGASGFMGRYVVNKLGKIGSQVVCPYRGDPYYVRDLKLAGDLGQILFLPYSIRDEDSLRKVMKYSNVVVNLVGSDFETRNFSFNDVHVDGARRIARIAKEMGVERLVHFSHLDATPNPQSIYVKGGSKYLKSKYYGELAVREEFPEAVIFRPSDIFGDEDRFLMYYANKGRRTYFGVPLWKRGKETIKMPVNCSDVAEGVVNAILNTETDGKVFECVGPSQYVLSDLVEYFMRCMRMEDCKATYMSPLYRMKVMRKSLPISNRLYSLDKLEREHVSDVTHELPTLEDLGVNLTKIEVKAYYHLSMFRLYNYYEAEVGKFPDPEPPTVHHPSPLQI